MPPPTGGAAGALTDSPAPGVGWDLLSHLLSNPPSHETRSESTEITACREGTQFPGGALGLVPHVVCGTHSNRGQRHSLQATSALNNRPVPFPPPLAVKTVCSVPWKYWNAGHRGWAQV